MNTFQKIALGSGIAIAAVVIFFTISTVEEPEPETIDPEAIAMMRDYPGVDGQGKKVGELLLDKFFEDYPDLDILSSSSIEIEWYAHEEEFQGQKLTKVGYSIQTFKEDSEYVWYMDKNSFKIIAGNDLGQKILDQLD